jgi:hypothetical protein
MTPVAVPTPNLTVEPDMNPLPLMVTAVPPAVVPELGLMLVIAGGAM